MRPGLKRIRDAFVATAKRAERLGIDALEVHCAHGYLLHQFLSPISNRRTDQYGGSLQNRMRFPLEVFDAVRAAFPQHKPVGIKVSSTDWVEGGWDIAQTIEFAKELKKRGVDWIDASSGGVSPLQKIPLGPGYQVPFAQAIKEATGVTTMAVGLITEAEAGRRDRRLRQGRHGRARARHALRPALGLARRGRTRRPGRSAAAILALAALDAEGAVRRDVRSARGSRALPCAKRGLPLRGLALRSEASAIILPHPRPVLSRARTRRAQKQRERKPHGTWIFRDALASAGVRIERGSRLGPAGAALAR